MIGRFSDGMSSAIGIVTDEYLEDEDVLFLASHGMFFPGRQVQLARLAESDDELMRAMDARRWAQTSIRGFY